jgi:hypothetical protein
VLGLDRYPVKHVSDRIKAAVSNRTFRSWHPPPDRRKFETRADSVSSNRGRDAQFAADPDVRHSRIRLPPRVLDGKPLARPGMKDARPREPVVGELREIAIDASDAGLADPGDLIEEAIGDARRGVVGIDEHSESGRTRFGRHETLSVTR